MEWPAGSGDKVSAYFMGAKVINYRRACKGVAVKYLVPSVEDLIIIIALHVLCLLTN